MIAFLDRLVGVQYTGPVVLGACLLAGGGLTAAFAWWEGKGE